MDRFALRFLMSMNWALTGPLMFCACAILLMGCNADPGARREIALLRTEIRDLEDQYFRLKHQCGVTDQAPEGSIIYESGEHCEVCGEPIYDTAPDLHSHNIQSNPTPPIQPVDPDVTPRGSQPSEEIEIQRPNDDSQSNSQPAVANNNIDLNQVAGQWLGDHSGISARQASTGGRNPTELAIEFSADGVDRNNDQLDDGISVRFNGLPDDLNEMTFSLMDPQLPSGEQRIGIWRFGREAIQKQRERGTGQRVQFFLPWKDAVPKHPSLLLFTRQQLGDPSTEPQIAEGSRPVLLKLDTRGDAVADRFLEHADGSLAIQSRESLEKSDQSEGSQRLTERANAGKWRPNR